ncbi:glycosyltransferase [Candidatus Omnitrophota bacterium]
MKRKEKMIVVACGGGIDGFEILNLYLKVHFAMAKTVKTILFPGPHMPEEKVKHLQMAIRKNKNIYIERFTGGTNYSLADWMNTADLFIGMSGYNTLAEILTTRVRSIIMPHHPRIEEEQFIHASALKKMNLIEMIDPRRTGKKSLLEAIHRNLHLEKLKQKQTKHMINGSIKAAKKIKQILNRAN